MAAAPLSRRLRRCIGTAAVGVALLTLGGCAQLPPLDGLFDDAAFDPPSEPVAVDKVFALDPAMRRYLDEKLRPAALGRDPRDALLEVLYRPGELRLEYESTRTRSASEAFAARAGNCLSLVVMSAAFAKALDVPVRFHAVSTPDSLSREGGLQFSSRHVNLSFEAPRGAGPGDAHRVLTVDFLPTADLRRQRARDLSEATVLAMFLNNRAAEALVAGDVDTAYAHVREALRRAPDYLVAHNTLAVVYLRHGDVARARRVLDALLAREPANVQALANLVKTLQRLGETRQAELAAQRLAAIEPVPAFHYLDQGIEALRRGDALSARHLFERELERDAYYHESHFWLAVALARLGQRGEAARHLREATDGSTSPQTRQRYAAKLEALRATLQ